MREYRITSPSLDSLLAHESIRYDNIDRPNDTLRLYDGPAKISLRDSCDEGSRIELERYFSDLYGVFMKRFSNFVVSSNIDHSDTLTLLAMLQEMIKVKNILVN
jgi:hypothetical protein